jgi:hypothetical protein
MPHAEIKAHVRRQLQRLTAQRKPAMYQLELTIEEKGAIETALNEQVGRALIRLADLAREIGPNSPEVAKLQRTIVRTERLVDKIMATRPRMMKAV